MTLGTSFRTRSFLYLHTTEDIYIDRVGSTEHLVFRQSYPIEFALWGEIVSTGEK